MLSENFNSTAEQTLSVDKNKRKIIRIILISISVILLLVLLYCVIFSPFHFWFMKYDADTGYVQGSNLTYHNGKLYVCYMDSQKTELISKTINGEVSDRKEIIYRRGSLNCPFCILNLIK